MALRKIFVRKRSVLDPDICWRKPPELRFLKCLEVFGILICEDTKNKNLDLIRSVFDTGCHHRFKLRLRCDQLGRETQRAHVRHDCIRGPVLSVIFVHGVQRIVLVRVIGVLEDTDRREPLNLELLCKRMVCWVIQAHFSNRNPVFLQDGSSLGVVRGKLTAMPAVRLVELNHYQLLRLNKGGEVRVVQENSVHIPFPWIFRGFRFGCSRIHVKTHA
mmetsp:Transcript_52752/g.124598  ORF Transcript_52752/g.124598 Transcript_52752/m.124598 type:complete len:217 (-) Transcript_52752:89-739(-)